MNCHLNSVQLRHARATALPQAYQADGALGPPTGAKRPTGARQSLQAMPRGDR